MIYEKLKIEAEHHGLSTYEKPLRPSTKGLYSDKVIWINSGLPSNIEKTCVLAEELGHYHTTAGNILDQRKLTNRKHESRARTWAYQKLVPLERIIKAHRSGIKNRHELAESLEITEEFLQDALNKYIEHYGLWTKVGMYTVCFEPLGVLEMFE
jgi:hypothetical protein